MSKCLNRIAAWIVSEECYSRLLKAGGVLLAAAMIGLAQVGPFLYDKDIQAYQAKYNIEAAARKEIDRIDCNALSANLVAPCNLAKHELWTLKSCLQLFWWVVESCLGFGFLLIVVSVVLRCIDSVLQGGQEHATRLASSLRRPRRGIT